MSLSPAPSAGAEMLTLSSNLSSPTPAFTDLFGAVSDGLSLLMNCCEHSVTSTRPDQLPDWTAKEIAGVPSPALPPQTPQSNFAASNECLFQNVQCTPICFNHVETGCPE